MIYLDTSFIAPRYISEATSEQIEQFLLQVDSNIAISDWTYVEFVSLLARRLRMREIQEEVMMQVIAMFEYDMRESFYVFTPTISDYKLAAHFLQIPSTGLRAGFATA
jgi:predicted nucleic acid-binding protein